MGEAKRRAIEIAKLREASITWEASLTEPERTIAHVAECLDTRLVRGRRFSEGCYHLALFMTRYLLSKNIKVTPIIGWVNDGTWKGMTSHAWIEFNGKTTDCSLTHTSFPDEQPTGALIIHDRTVRRGMANYSYFKNTDLQVAAAIKWMRTIPEFRTALEYKQVQHAQMMEIATSEGKIRDYLAMAPSGGRFEEIVQLIDL